MLLQVEWRPIPSAEGYEAASDGRIRSRWRVLIVRDNGHGYKRLKLSVRNRQFDAYVHRLVCEAFHGPCPPDHEARHLDGRSDNNAASNLCWGTRVENAADKVRHGTVNHGERAGHAVLTTEQVMAIRARAATGEELESIARDFGVTRACIGDVYRGRRWKHLPGALPPRRKFLTKDDVADIRARVAAGARKVDVARHYGVLWGTVNRCVNGARHARASGGLARE